MSEESTDIKIDQPLDQAALNEEAAKELAAMVAAETTEVEAQDSGDAGATYQVQSSAERAGIIEALIFVSEEPISAKTIAELLREERSVVDEALAELSREFNGRNGGLHARVSAFAPQRQALDRIVGNAGGDCLQTAGHGTGDTRDSWSPITLFDQNATRQETDCGQRPQRYGWPANDVRNFKRVSDAVWLEGSLRASEHGRLSGPGRRLLIRSRRQEQTAGVDGR